MRRWPVSSLAMKNKTFNQWLLPKCEAEMRKYTQYLFHQHKGEALGIDSGDLYNDVIAKLVARNPPVNDRHQLFGLLKVASLNRMTDLWRKKSTRDKYISIPMPIRGRPMDEGPMERVAAKQLSPAQQVGLNDQIEVLKERAAEDPDLAILFQAFSDLVEQGEPTSVLNISNQLKRPYNQVANSIERLRTIARRVL